MTQPLDDTDVALVRALQADARRSNKELAAQIGLAPSSTHQRLRRLRARAYGLAGEFNGRGVRQGSLYPPTETHRARLEQLQEALRREMNGSATEEQTEEGSR